jgi:hypothetical protein
MTFERPTVPVWMNDEGYAAYWAICILQQAGYAALIARDTYAWRTLAHASIYLANQA